MKRARFLPAFLAVTLLLLVPLAISYGYIGARFIFNLFAADSMYYLAIANNFVKFGFPTFDGLTVSNGFHPLWGYLLMGLFKVSGISHHSQIYLVFLASLLLAYAGYLMIAAGLVRLLGSWRGFFATLLFFPGGYMLFFAPMRHVFMDAGVLYTVTPYSALNGMETPLSVFLWAACFLIFISRYCLLARENALPVRPMERFFPFSMRLCLAALVMARLDDIFLLPAIAIAIASQKPYSWREKMTAFFHIAWPTAYILCIYMMLNRWATGVFLPTSGMNKLSLYPLRNLLVIWHVFSGDMSNSGWSMLAIRVFPPVFSLVAGAGCIILSRWQKHGNAIVDILLPVFGWFLVLKALFLCLLVPFMNQGYWYYFPMIFIFNIIIAYVIAGRIDEKYILVSVIFYMAVLVFRMPSDINFLTWQKEGRWQSDDSYDLWVQGPAIRDFLRKNAPGAKLVDNSDGAVAYMLDMPAESCTGLPSSPVVLQERKMHGFWRPAISKGFSIVPMSGSLAISYGCDPHSDPKEVRVGQMLIPPSSRFRFERVELVRH